MASSEHMFYIPVMGTGFTIDTPFRVARYGISSVISLVDDVLIEQMRKRYSEKEGIPYKEIFQNDEDARARRITAYLNLVHDVVSQQVKSLALEERSFEKESEIVRYYEMLPDSPSKKLYRKMLGTADVKEKCKMQKVLREHVIPGSIDVNIMTKLDRDRYHKGKKLDQEFSDALSALRGYANSVLQSSIVFSAGMNPRLFAYLDMFDDFFPDKNGLIKKKIILKVSDYRSAMIQGKYLAKRGIWVSEYRVESAFNCGGHAFVSEGRLMGPVLQEFKDKREELLTSLQAIYLEALQRRGKYQTREPLKLRFSVQGGISNSNESSLLLRYYNMDATGWGTPFLFVPEATSVDEGHLEKLMKATDDDVYLSDSSPLSIPFWNLKNSSSEEARRKRIRLQKPGSLCPKGFAVTSKEFTEKPLCLASRAYQRRKLEKLSSENLEITEERRAALEEEILGKSCICHDLAGSATIKHKVDEAAHPAICCGPSAAYFSSVAKLEEMVSHIYGRISLLGDSYRPHMFAKELIICKDFLIKEIKKYSLGISSKRPKYFKVFKENLLKGIEYYFQYASDLFENSQECFLSDLEKLQNEIESIAVLLSEARLSEPVATS